MARKTKAQAQETRHQIIDAAERVFHAQGVARTSLQQVAAEAGLTRGAIYWHFKDKAALFAAMMDRAVLPCEAAMAQVREAPPASALNALIEMAMIPIRSLACDAQLTRVFSISMHYTEYTEELAPAQRRYQNAVSEFVAMTEDTMQQAAQAGQLRQGLDLHTLAMGLFALVDGLMRQWTAMPQSFELVHVGQQAVSAYVMGLTRSI